jgi:hypothetical protein
VKDTTRQFLVGALRAHLTGDKTPSATLPVEAVDWDALVPLAAFHRVAPLLERALREGGASGVPTSARAELAAYVRTISHRSLLLTGELARLLKQLEAGGVQAIPFKGPALAALLYGDPALRHFDDLDVLVRAADFPAAKETVLALGFQPREQHSLHESFSRVRGDMEIVLELHWAFMPLPEVFPFDSHLEAAWARCETVSLGGHKALAFAPADQLLYLCAHGSRHLWFRLQWICDVAQLIHTRPDLDWPRLMAQAKASGGPRMLYLGLSLAHDLLGAPLPPEIAQALRRDRHTAKLADQVKHQLYEGPLEITKPWKGTLFPLQLIAHWPDRLLYLPRLWFQKLTAANAHHQQTNEQKES